MPNRERPSPEDASQTSPGDAFLDAIVMRLTRRGALTRRMSEALGLYVRGWPRDEAARHMRCSLNTYRNHIAAALRRVGADAATELLRVVALDLDEEHTRPGC